jgi:hypothetical protein
MSWTRRDFLVGSSRGALAATFVGATGTLPRLFGMAPSGTSVDAELANLVLWLRQVPQDRLLSELLEKLSAGVEPSLLWSATMLAGVEELEPRPLGGRYHAVTVMPSLWHVASLLQPKERILPLVFGMCSFKRAQLDEASGADWTLPPPDDKSLPSIEQARAMLLLACERWDAPSADLAITTLAREATRDEIVSALMQASLRDWSGAGHCAIAAANAFRMLDLIGWDRGEPVLRSLVLGLLGNGTGDTTTFDLACAAADQLLAAEGNGAAPGSVASVGPLLRRDVTPSPGIAITEAAGRIAASTFEKAEEPLWSDLETIGLELLLESPGALAQHATIGIQALRDLSRRTGVRRTRMVAVLQAAAWCSLWRAMVGGNGDDLASTLAKLHADAIADVPRNVEPVDALLAALGASDRRDTALRIDRSLDPRQPRNARPTTAVLARQRAFVVGARSLLVAKGRDTHDYEFFAALHDAAMPKRIGPGFEPSRLAAGSYALRGPADADYAPVATVREALGG